MNFLTARKLIARVLVATAASASAAAVLAIDLVHRKSNDKPVGGEITKNTRDGVTVTQQVGMKEEVVPAADITYIEWDGEPGPVKLARGSETTGALDESVKQYQEAQKAVGSAKDGLKSDVQYGLARATARRALRTGDDLPGAVTAVKAFVNSSRDNYRYFDSQMLLGELSLATGDFTAAEIAYQSVAGASSNDFQKAGKIGMARAMLGRGDVSKAKAMFGEVASAPPSGGEEGRRLEATLGQALCLLQDKDVKGAKKLVDQVIDEAKPVDGRIQAEAYLRQGDLVVAEGGPPKAAIISYLHVDVIPEFAAERELHAEALYQLAKLWPQVGEADRGADAASRLKSQYPTSQWAKKLSGG